MSLARNSLKSVFTEVYHANKSVFFSKYLLSFHILKIMIFSAEFAPYDIIIGLQKSLDWLLSE